MQIQPRNISNRLKLRARSDKWKYAQILRGSSGHKRRVQSGDNFQCPQIAKSLHQAHILGWVGPYGI